MKTYHVYILKCIDDTYYTGMTSDLQLRINQHETGFFKRGYTSYRLPVQLEFYCSFQNVKDAIEMEKQIKKWSKSKKESLINGDYESLQNLAKKKF